MIKIINENYKINTGFYLEKLKEIIKEIKLKGTISIRLGDKAESKDLNQKYLNRYNPTDVLSFPINEKLPDGLYCGDIFICYPIAMEQAEENKTDIQEELLTLMVHGILHLAGYNHEEDSGEMTRLQEILLKKVKNG